MKKKSSLSKAPPTFDSERALQAEGVAPTAGVDEAGRGPLAGPVIAAAVVFSEKFIRNFTPNDTTLQGLHDSKKMSLRLRERLFITLTTHPLILWSVGEASVEEIGELNILRATHLAMKRALLGLPKMPAHALIDGLPVRDFPIAQTALIGGDGLSLSIAAASVIAKVTRDRMMEILDKEFPHYGFAQHRGYGTALHLAQLNHHGPCPYHRRGFAPVDQAARRF